MSITIASIGAGILTGISHPVTTFGLLTANTVMNGIELKNQSEMKAGIARAEHAAKTACEKIDELHEIADATVTYADMKKLLAEPTSAPTQPQGAPQSQPMNNYSAESLDAAYQRGVAEAQAKAAADKAAAEKAAAEAAAQKELADLRAQVAALTLASASTPGTTPATPTAAPASDAEPAWLGKFVETFAKITAEQVNTAVKSALTAPPAPTEDKKG